MFSSRTRWLRQPNRLAHLIEERRKAGKSILDLTLSNPTDAGFAYPEREILSALSNAPLVYTPDPRGLARARESVAAYYAGQQADIHPSDIILTASTSEAYSYLFMLLCEPGDDVLVPVPAYPLFEYLAQLQHVHLIPYLLRYDGEWHIDIDSLSKGITSSTRAIILISPHNPTGVFLKRHEWEILNGIAIKYHLALIVDEVFAEFAFKQDDRRVKATAASREALTFALNGISKSCGLPQLKAGWIVVGGRREVRSEARERLEIIADTFLSVNQPVQHALPELLELGKSVREQMRKRTVQNLSLLEKSLPSDSPISLLSTEGGWYAVLRVPATMPEEEWALRLLDESGVYLYPGYFFEFQENGYLVVSLLPQCEVFEEGVKSIVRTIG